MYFIRWPKLTLGPEEFNPSSELLACIGQPVCSRLRGIFGPAQASAGLTTVFVAVDGFSLAISACARGPPSGLILHTLSWYFRCLRKTIPFWLFAGLFVELGSVGGGWFREMWAIESRVGSGKNYAQLHSPLAKATCSALTQCKRIKTFRTLHNPLSYCNPIPTWNSSISLPNFHSHGRHPASLLFTVFSISIYLKVPIIFTGLSHILFCLRLQKPASAFARPM